MDLQVVQKNDLLNVQGQPASVMTSELKRLGNGDMAQGFEVIQAYEHENGYNEGFNDGVAVATPIAFDKGIFMGVVGTSILALGIYGIVSACKSRKEAKEQRKTQYESGDVNIIQEK